MEVLVGPAFSIEASPSTPSAKHHQVVAQQTVLFVAEEEDGGSEGSPISSRVGSGIGFADSPDESSDSSSSIGAADDSDEEDDGTVVSSSSKDVVGSLDSLEEALPIKRGLSNYYSGKSKSFGNLADVSSVKITKDLEKPENPFNKRRRLLFANKWSRRSFYSWSNPKSMPLLTLKEDQDEDGEDDYDRDGGNEDEQSPSSSSSSSSSVTQEQRVPQKQSTAHKLYRRRLGATLKSQSCFSLADLQEEEQYFE